MGPGASHLICSEPCWPGRKEVPRRTGPGASHLACLKRETNHPAMAAVAGERPVYVAGIPLGDNERQILIANVNQLFDGSDMEQIRQWVKLIAERSHDAMYLTVDAIAV